MTGEDVRSTPQRRAVLSVVEQAADHPTATEVLERVQEILPGVGSATVYRALGLLVESGQVLELRLGPSSASRYDRNIAHHDHLVCDSCGTVEDVTVPIDRGAMLDRLGTDHGFTVTGYDLRVHGLCATCHAATRPLLTTAN